MNTDTFRRLQSMTLNEMTYRDRALLDALRGGTKRQAEMVLTARHLYQMAEVNRSQIRSWMSAGLRAQFREDALDLDQRARDILSAIAEVRDGEPIPDHFFH